MCTIGGMGHWYFPGLTKRGQPVSHARIGGDTQASSRSDTGQGPQIMPRRWAVLPRLGGLSLEGLEVAVPQRSILDIRLRHYPVQRGAIRNYATQRAAAR